MIPRSQHDCKTVFVGGINPWGEYSGPPVAPALIGYQKVLALLADGKPRSAKEVASATGYQPSAADDRLRKLFRDGKLNRTLMPSPEPKSRHRAFYMYWVERPGVEQT